MVAAFCAANFLPVPKITVEPARGWMFPDACAYYRAGEITICVDRCAAVGVAGRQWSCPGYVVDRTPYGVLQHELGHYVDVMRSTRRGRYMGDLSIALREASGAAPVTSYCPNAGEWFAEMFRVFVTNPDLLRLIRPRIYPTLATLFAPVFRDTWRDRLAGAPERTIAAAARRVSDER